MNSVAVLLSCFNGEKYITEQISSILNQKDVDITLFIRDDCSTDNTVSIIKKFEEKNQNIVFIPSTGNLGVKDSFLTLLEYALNYDFHYFAFADQDDFWLENKLVSAINKIIESNNNSKHALYFSNKTFVDQDLKHISDETIKFRNDVLDAYCSCVASGCTMVFNKNLASLAVNPIPTSFDYHDSWLFRLAMYIGANVVFDNNSYILYRQHSNNVCGMTACKSYESNFNKNINYLLNSKKSSWRLNNFSELNNLHYDLISQNFKDINKWVLTYKSSFTSKWKLLFLKLSFKRGPRFYFYWFLKVLLNKL